MGFPGGGEWRRRYLRQDASLASIAGKRGGAMSIKRDSRCDTRVLTPSRRDLLRGAGAVALAGAASGLPLFTLDHSKGCQTPGYICLLSLFLSFGAFGELWVKAG